MNQDTSRKLCGYNCAYLAECILLKNPSNYLTNLRENNRWPSQGMTLREIEAYLTRRGIKCELTTSSRQEIEQGSIGDIYILATDLDKNPHAVLVRRISATELMCYNPPLSLTHARLTLISYPCVKIDSKQPYINECSPPLFSLHHLHVALLGAALAIAVCWSFKRCVKR